MSWSPSRGTRPRNSFDAAIEQASAAQPSVATLPVAVRAEVLQTAATLLQQRAEPFADEIVATVGKTIRDARVEVKRAVVTLQATADALRNIRGDVLDASCYDDREGKMAVVKPFPIGMVAALTPFNFPINIAAHKLGPAFAAGNAVLFKPAPQTYTCGKMFVQLMHEAGVPTGALQLVLPDIPGTQMLVADERIGFVNFTGGTAGGRALAAAAALKPMIMELGGNDPLIVMHDADVDLAVEVTVAQRFGTAGQRCTAAKRVFVHKDVHDTFVEQLLQRTSNLVVGDPASEATDVGPLISQAAAIEVMEAIEALKAEGATVHCGYQRDGAVVWPTVLTGIAFDSLLHKTEIFGPVASVVRFEHLADAISAINASPYGLQAGVMTNDLSVARSLYEQLGVGALAVNDGPGFRAEHLPFGGVKQSGVGREGVRYAIEAMSTYKTWIV